MKDICDVKKADNGYIIEWWETKIIEKDAKRLDRRGNVVGTFDRTETVYHTEVFLDLNLLKERVKKLALVQRGEK